MAKDDKNIIKKIEQEEQYIAFLKKRLESENFKVNVTEEEYKITKKKLEKAKFKLRVLKGE